MPDNITIEVENNVVRIIEDIPQPPKPDPKIIEKSLNQLYDEKTNLLNQKDALIAEKDSKIVDLQTALDENVLYIDKQLEVIQKAIDDGILQGAILNEVNLKLKEQK